MKKSNGKQNGNGLNGNSEKRERTAARIIEAVKECKGLLTLVAEKTGLGYRTVNRYATEFPTVQEAVREAKEGMVDLAESKLFAAIDKGDAWAICFYLKTQAKHRGYVERQEITGEGGKPVKTEIIVRSDNAKTLTQQILEGKGT